MCLPCIDASGFTGLSIYRGTFEKTAQNPKSQTNKIGYPQGYAHTGYSFSAVVPARPRGV